MKISPREGVIIEGYTKKEKDVFQTEVIRIILADKKKLHAIIFRGNTDDVDIETKKKCFFVNFRYAKSKAKDVNARWDALIIMMDNPKYLIIYFDRKTEKGKYLDKKLKKDGTPRKPPIKKKLPDSQFNKTQSVH